ncbi:hypothetical protein KKC44_05245 [Patescibacteria group bacterium]|nr:hypothetical protein [Patescibacteria group bacterium]MBU2259980.1 hypothetical protein [Patescibacteria group bacterium]
MATTEPTQATALNELTVLIQDLDDDLMSETEKVTTIEEINAQGIRPATRKKLAAAFAEQEKRLDADIVDQDQMIAETKEKEMTFTDNDIAERTQIADEAIAELLQEERLIDEDVEDLSKGEDEEEIEALKESLKKKPEGDDIK